MVGSSCQTAQSYLTELGLLVNSLKGAAIEKFADVLFEAWKDRRQVFIFGNGGSASTASHHVLDLVKTAAVEGQLSLRAIALNDNVGLLTAVSNDVAFADSFSFPLSLYAESGDVAVAISCSGNSPNIVNACRTARQRGLTVVALTGFSGGKVAGDADVHVNVPSSNYGIIEDLHLSVGHMVAQILHSKILNSVKEAAACKS